MTELHLTSYRQRLAGWPAVLLSLAATIGCVLLVRQVHIKYLPPPGLLFLLPILFAATLGGWRMAMLCCAMVAVALLSGVLPTPRSGTSMLLEWILPFGVISFIISYVIERLQLNIEVADLQRRWHESTLAHVDDVVVVTNAAGVIEYVNRAGCELVSKPAAELKGRSFEQFFDVRDASTDRPSSLMVAGHLNRTRTLHQQISQVLVRADGQRVPVEVTVAPVRDQQSQLVSVVYTLRDRTLQRNAESVTQERLLLQSRLEHIARALPGAIHEYRVLPGGQRQLSYASVGFVHITGIEPGAFADDATVLETMVHPDDRTMVISAVRHGIAHLARIDHEFRLVTPHRGLVWVALSTQPIRESEGVLVFRGTLTDVTARKQAEEQLYASQVQLRAALDAGGMGQFRIDVASSRVEMDGVARAICGLPTSEDHALSIDDLASVIHPEDRPVLHADYLDMSRGPHAYQRRFRLSSHAQHEQWIECRGRVFPDESQGTMVMMGVLADVTEVFQNAERNLHSQKLEALGVLAGGIAHDFNNLLQAISGNALLLLTELPSSHPQRETVREIDKACARASELVQRILAFSRPDSHEQRRGETRLNDVLSEAVTLVRATASPDVLIKCSFELDLPAIIADDGQLHQVFVNLLGNALDVVPRHGGIIQCSSHSVTLDARECLTIPGLHPGDYLCVCIADNGPGIPAENLSRIFDPFFTTKAKGRGTGLGLSIVHGHMKSHGGAISVGRSAMGGALMTLYFPVQTQYEHGTQTLRALSALPVQARILYVDDEEPLVLLMSRLLQRVGHQVTGCASPTQALEVFRDAPHAFDLVVSDMSMPELDGLELARHMLALRPDLPFVITSGYIDPEQNDLAHAAGVRKIMLKPNTVQELGALIGELADEMRPAHALLEAGATESDPV